MIIKDFPDFNKITKAEKLEKKKEFIAWYDNLGENKEQELNKYLEKFEYPNFPPRYVPLTDEFMERWILEKKEQLEEAIATLEIKREQDECENQPEKIFDDGNFSSNDENRKKFNELFEKMKSENNERTDIIPAESCSSVAPFNINSYGTDNLNWINHRITKKDVENIKINEKVEKPINLDEFIRLRKMEDEKIRKKITETGSKIDVVDGKEQIFNIDSNRLTRGIKDEYKEEKDIYEKLKK